MSDLLFFHAFGFRAVRFEGCTVKYSTLQCRGTILGFCVCVCARARLSLCGQVHEEYILFILPFKAADANSVVKEY